MPPDTKVLILGRLKRAIVRTLRSRVAVKLCKALLVVELTLSGKRLFCPYDGQFFSGFLLPYCQSIIEMPNV
ncbi:hypothetical protein [Aerosakkonema funiforme]|uniref:Uncharacterized protein n=1 Tax=Aerosakkonema funiforme FACHB-1375 TaxID=2949571 RepID=A0A926VIC9_9CYAN|nr:hypothetical protein [Aerosakkonema funiforme]MBD2184339.1 hypothetical protein [Aerosakkonema funiforme FACHB-1375]